MTSYAVRIAVCPGCKEKLAVWSVSSCNTFHAKFFTDGFIEGPMYDEGGDLARCHTCRTVFWMDEVSAGPYISASEIPRCVRRREMFLISSPELSSYPALLESNLWRTVEEEKYIRMRAWWAWNDQRRRDAAASDSPFSPNATANCERLLEILDDTVDDEAILRAEIYRELGRFQECLKQLDRPFDPRCSSRLRVIMALAESGRCGVSQIE
ncbi:MAG: hypothetical protein FJ224_09925 [Lentisphaerae bacterium]|nr:hypothetical protein [Lentisphaerota bacterium]